MPLAENQSDFFRVWNINVIMIRSRPEITQLFIFFTHNTRQMQKLMPGSALHSSSVSTNCKGGIP